MILESENSDFGLIFGLVYKDIYKVSIETH
jgi:hypothetical protein